MGVGFAGERQEVRRVARRSSRSSPASPAARRRTRGSSRASGSGRPACAAPATCRPGERAGPRSPPQTAPGGRLRRRRRRRRRVSRRASARSSGGRAGPSSTRRPRAASGAGARPCGCRATAAGTGRPAGAATSLDGQRPAAGRRPARWPAAGRRARRRSARRRRRRRVEPEAGRRPRGPVGEQPDGRVAAAAPAERRPAAGGSGGTGHSASPVIPSGSRLVARTRSSGQAREQPRPEPAAASITCSQLSRISSVAPVGRARGSAVRRVRAGCPGPRQDAGLAAARARRSRPGQRGRRRPGRPAARSTKRPRRPPAPASIASRVLPAPPGPVSVTSRASGAAGPTRARSSSRPTKLVSWAGTRDLTGSGAGPATGSGSARSIARWTADSSADGSAPNSSASIRRVLLEQLQRLALPSEPYSARISCARGRSRSGWASASPAARATSSRCSPSASRAAVRSSSAAIRAPRTGRPAAAGRPARRPAPARATGRAPRSSRAAALGGSPAARPASSASRWNRCASTSCGSTASRYPAAEDSTVGEPFSARRSRDTWDWRAFPAPAGGSSPYRPSIRHSEGTTRPRRGAAAPAAPAPGPADGDGRPLIVQTRPSPECRTA